MKVRGLIFGIGLLLALASTQAGPQLLPTIQSRLHPAGWEINTPFFLERTPGETEMDSPLFDLNYGLPNVQLKLEIPISVVHDDGDGTRAGAGDLLVGMRFLNNEQSKFQLGVCPRVLLPTRDRARTRRGSVCVSFPCGAQKGGTNARSPAMSVFGGRQLANAQLLLCGRSARS